MSTILYCKDSPVYDLDTGAVLNSELLPGIMARLKGNEKYGFDIWTEQRKSSRSNSSAVSLRTQLRTQSRGNLINKTRFLSLSDCYWIKDSGNNVTFKEVSPYYNDFWKGKDEYKGQSVPTIYVDGALSKEWVSKDCLVKYTTNALAEHQALELCNALEIPAAKSELVDSNTIKVSNFTNPDSMLETGAASGKFTSANTDSERIIEYFGEFGLQMILVDAIVGNGDRHEGNFGWLRDSNTGEYLEPAPLYDFDHALDSKISSDVLTGEAEDLIVKHNYVEKAKELLKKVINLTDNEIFKARAIAMFNNLNKDIITEETSEFSKIGDENKNE